MVIKQLIDEDFVNYKKPSMVIAFSRCNFKCDKELCQNSPLSVSPDIEISVDAIIKRYLENNLTSAVCCAGLDPLDTYDQLLEFVKAFREVSNDDIAIYTGYCKNEIIAKVREISKYPNIVMKYGRYIPNQSPHYDDVLGVYLASDNQYAEKIS